MTVVLDVFYNDFDDVEQTITVDEFEEILFYDGEVVTPVTPTDTETDDTLAIPLILVFSNLVIISSVIIITKKDVNKNGKK